MVVVYVAYNGDAEDDDDVSSSGFCDLCCES